MVTYQVISPFLIILRVANRRALTSDAIVSGNVSSLRFDGQGKLTGGSVIFIGARQKGLADTHGKTTELSVETVQAADSHCDKV